MAIIMGVKELEMPGSAVCMTWGSLKSWIVPMMESSMASRAAPRTFGSLMCRAICQPVAPSMRAASYKSWGMACRAARKMSMLYPVKVQVVMLAMDARTTLPAKKSTVMPMEDRPLTMGEICGL